MVGVVMRAMAAERKRKRISQTEVARRMGVAPAAVSRWESGTRDLQLGTFIRYAGTFSDITGIRRAILLLRE